MQNVRRLKILAYSKCFIPEIRRRAQIAQEFDISNKLNSLDLENFAR